MRPDFNHTATLALHGFIMSGQLKLDEYLCNTFIGLVKAELEKAFRAGRHAGGLTDAERASCFRVGLEKGADIVKAAGSLPYTEPVPELLKAIEAAIRGQAERLR